MNFILKMVMIPLFILPCGVLLAEQQVVQPQQTQMIYIEDNTGEVEVLEDAEDYTVSVEELENGEINVSDTGQMEVRWNGRRPLVRAGAFVIRGTARVIRGGIVVGGRVVRRAIRVGGRIVYRTVVIGGKIIRGVAAVATRETYCVTVTLKDGKTVNFVRTSQTDRFLLSRLWTNARVDGVLDCYGYSTKDGTTEFRRRIPSGDIMNITVRPCTTVYLR